MLAVVIAGTGRLARLHRVVVFLVAQLYRAI
jgi:hypothetical protein